MENINKIHILLFYKFVPLKDLEALQKKHLRYMKELDVKGRILLAEEGINGSVSGTKKQIEEYKNWLKKDNKFNDVNFKEEIGLEHPFRRTQVVIRDEIVAIGKKINMNKKADYISPKELKELYDKKEEFVILDARNYYEYKVGKFKNAIHLDIKTFREFPEALGKIENLKDKKIITYCTGGIRCEKASAVMKEAGFKKVYQLKDGILTFGKEYPNSYWEGKCFVFDKRLISDMNNSNEKTITKCETCDELSDLYRNCRNVHCDKLYIQCKPCQENFNGCCSKKCFEVFKIQCLNKSFKNQGRRIEKINLISNN